MFLLFGILQVGVIPYHTGTGFPNGWYYTRYGGHTKIVYNRQRICCAARKISLRKNRQKCQVVGNDCIVDSARGQQQQE